MERKSGSKSRVLNLISNGWKVSGKISEHIFGLRYPVGKIFKPDTEFDIRPDILKGYIFKPDTEFDIRSDIL